MKDYEQRQLFRSAWRLYLLAFVYRVCGPFIYSCEKIGKLADWWRGR